MAALLVGVASNSLLLGCVVRNGLTVEASLECVVVGESNSISTRRRPPMPDVGTEDSPGLLSRFEVLVLEVVVSSVRTTFGIV